MLQSIHIKNGFRHADSTFSFLKGLTSITGQNESGKSLIMEFVRYALWGTAALRGSAGDYKKLEVTLRFQVKGLDYKIYRGKSQARLWQVVEDKLVDMATGTVPVNGAVKTLFGYDMTVFDVANCCNQGEIEALGRMRPAERKKMVDQTIGLQFIDDIIAWATAEALAAQRSVDSLMSTVANVPQPPIDPQLVKPVEVVLPANFKQSHELRPEIDKLMQEKHHRSTLEGVLTKQLVAPVAPTLIDMDSEAVILTAMRARELVQNNITAINAELSRIVAPPYNAAQLDHFTAQIEDHGKWCQKKKLLAGGSLTCPSCKHTWPILADQLAPLADVVEVDAPPMGVSLTSIATWKRMLTQQDRKGQLEKDLADENAKLAQLPDRSRDLSIRRQYDSELRTYEIQKSKHQVDIIERGANEQRLGQMSSHADLDARIIALQHEIEAAVKLQAQRTASLEAISVYERQLVTYNAQIAQYEKAKKQHQELVLKVEEEKATAEGMARGRDALKELKVRIKQFLVPSLNKVASHLISEMTGGKRSLIQVDEDFNIKVDGADLATLSGSGKSVANLAIRIGLGQVLTNKVFPVFMADEIDAAMDQERAGYTAECLAGLTSDISQVILISHKKPVADYYIELV